MGWRLQSGDEKGMKIKDLSPSMLRRRCDVTGWRFSSTDDIPESAWLLGQDRALEAIEFAAEMPRKGYNIFAICADDSGFRPGIQAHLKALADTMPTPSDWVYVYNFKDPQRPTALEVGAGKGPAFKHSVDKAVNNLRRTIPKIFGSDEYQARLEAIDREANDAIERLQNKADACDVTIISTGAGFKMVPLRDGRPMTEDDLDDLSDGERRRIEMIVEELEEELQAIVEKLPEWEERSQELRKELNEQVCQHAVERAMQPVIRDFGGKGKRNRYLEALFEDLMDNIELFDTGAEEENPLAMLGGGQSDPFARYRVNVVVSRGDDVGAPVMVEDHPTYGRLVGSINQSSSLAGPAFDFMGIKPGALHKAHGGFLVINAEELIRMPLGWDVLKRSLRSEDIVIDTPNDWYGETGYDKLEPEPIPIQCKIVLVGDRYWHYRLSVVDPDFPDLFKVAADFAEDMNRSNGGDEAFAMVVAKIAREEVTRAFSAAAVGKLVEESARFAEDAEKVSVLIDPLRNLMLEAEYWASKNGHIQVSAEDVAHALRMRDRRLSQLRDRSQEYILREFIQIETTGSKVGQVNGLVVTGLEQSFGRPSRITARARMGDGLKPVIEQVVDIQSEADLSGSSHAKGVMILGGFLQERYAPDHPLSLSATLVFEQSYSFVDGDSASCAELCTLLSAIGNIPLRQDLAITGAISQHGEMMAIGGVNEKIEGFFDICAARKLTGDQGVIIPEANVKDLMLRPDVVEAVRSGQFAVYAVTSADEAMELLTGLKPGKRLRGKFSRGSFNRKVEDRLATFENMRRKANRPWRR